MASHRSIDVRKMGSAVQKGVAEPPCHKSRRDRRIRKAKSGMTPRELSSFDAAQSAARRAVGIEPPR